MLFTFKKTLQRTQKKMYIKFYNNFYLLLGPEFEVK